MSFLESGIRVDIGSEAERPHTATNRLVEPDCQHVGRLSGRAVNSHAAPCFQGNPFKKGPPVFINAHKHKKCRKLIMNH